VALCLNATAKKPYMIRLTHDSVLCRVHGQLVPGIIPAGPNKSYYAIIGAMSVSDSAPLGLAFGHVHNLA